jgi:hypothetical protein
MVLRSNMRSACHGCVERLAVVVVAEHAEALRREPQPLAGFPSPSARSTPGLGWAFCLFPRGSGGWGRCALAEALSRPVPLALGRNEIVGIPNWGKQDRK